jgi:hypothetical protein
MRKDKKPRFVLKKLRAAGFLIQENLQEFIDNPEGNLD